MEQRVIAEVNRRLASLEQSEDMAILLSVESGSRAWGFESTDSDYDVRFIYIRRPDAYLSIDLETHPDVIEQPIVDDIDISGWDIRKALKLFQKSNPPLLEWLQSPLIYIERHSFAAKLRALLPDFYSPRNCFHHYFHMARGNFREYLRGDTVRRKKYFYVLRPLLALRWLELDLGPVPMEFLKLVDRTITDTPLRQAIDDLVIAKRAGVEMDDGPPISIISDFIEREMPRLKASLPICQNKSLRLRH
ncbi:MAG TPA: nucleotidyltransferase domain-containing protein [Candidatus Limnocylindrales bacterium]|nr:nucleotidyltransferase domain-containing protein [Candidatus Limnocylindrales bacterium]